MNRYQIIRPNNQDGYLVVDLTKQDPDGSLNVSPYSREPNALVAQTRRIEEAVTLAGLLNAQAATIPDVEL